MLKSIQLCPLGRVKKWFCNIRFRSVLNGVGAEINVAVLSTHWALGGKNELRQK